jgi:hypothetical protein
MGVDVMLTSFGDFHILQIYTKSKLAKILGINIHKAAQWGLFILSSFLNYRSSPHFCATVFLGVDFVLILTKKRVGIHFGRFFTNSSGHPVRSSYEKSSAPPLHQGDQIG